MAAMPATPKQLKMLRALAVERGMSFAWPETSTQASAEIARLLGTRRSSAVERLLDRTGLQEARAAVLPASSVGAGETSGYGSSASWAGAPERPEPEEPIRPSAAQLSLIRTLASERGATYVHPPTAAAASEEIARLKALPRLPRRSFPA